MEIADQFVLSIAEQSAVGEARRRAARLAESKGFDEVKVGQISIAATELANNLIKHTPSGGKIIVGWVAPLQSLDLVAINKGGGAEDTTLWFEDGYSTTGTMGTGLGAVKRLAKKFDLHSDTAHGTTIHARFLRNENDVAYEMGVVNLPLETEEVCGDSWAAVMEGESLSVMVADGLGHGVDAHAASDLAATLFRNIAFNEPSEILQELHVHLKGTRGAAISVLQIFPERSIARFSGLGNITAMLLTEEKRKHLVPDNGTVGYELRKVRSTEIEWTPNDVAILHSDGISSSWNLNHYDRLVHKNAAVIASTIYRDHYKRHDDATIMVVKPIIRY